MFDGIRFDLDVDEWALALQIDESKKITIALA